VVAKIREGLTVSKQAAQKFDGERFNLRKLNELEVMKQYQIEITNRFAALENLSDNEDIIVKDILIIRDIPLKTELKIGFRCFIIRIIFFNLFIAKILPTLCILC